MSGIFDEVHRYFDPDRGTRGICGVFDRRLLLALFPLASLATRCAPADGDNPDARGSEIGVKTGATSTAGATATPTNEKAIGDPCTDEGWRPESDVPSADTEPLTPVPVRNEQPPPGTGYCLTGQLYPHGYFTMNCGGNPDSGVPGAGCPEGAVCDGLQCRRPCDSNQDCTPPTLCEPGGPDFKYCLCNACVTSISSPPPPTDSL